MGKDVDPQFYHELVYGDAVDRLMNKALCFLSYRPRSEKELRDYLSKKVKTQKSNLKTGENTSEGLITVVVSRLKELNFVDDAVFAAWWVEQRIRFKPRGKVLLRSELFKKGVDRKQVDLVLNNYSAEDEISWAEKLLQKKDSRYSGMDLEERKRKISSLLSRRGFSWDAINTVLGE